MHEKNVRSSPHGSYPATAVIIQGATIRALKKNQLIYVVASNKSSAHISKAMSF